MQSRRLSNDVIEISGGVQPSSNVYLIISKKILIDLGSGVQAYEIANELAKYKTKPTDIKSVIFSHLHFDHTGNPGMFSNAKFYASQEELDSLKLPINLSFASKFRGIKLNPLGDRIESLKVIKTPGHTSGSVCLWKEDDQILFSGDTLFRTGAIGRTDLPTSMPPKMQSSLMKLARYNYKILAPGHNLEHGRLLQ